MGLGLLAIQARGEHHIFYLQAPRELGSPLLRHHHASIGHAVSHDLRAWRVLPDALHPGPDGSWDDLATWTGSTLEHDGRWYMLYTGISRREEGLIQRIGLAVSDDLVTWVKHPGNPVLEADPRWYDLLQRPRWRDQSWRDPWLFRHPHDGSFHCLITARSPLGAADAAGVIGHARSRDLIDWEVLPPLTAPGDFAQVEAPQLVQVDGWYALLVSAQAEDHSRQRIERLQHAGGNRDLRLRLRRDVRALHPTRSADRRAGRAARRPLCRQAPRTPDRQPGSSWRSAATAIATSSAS